jgi:hypothetical protein
MNIDYAKKVIDLDEFLPLDGEDRVDIFYEDGSLRLEIFYESTDGKRVSRLVIEFINADYFVKSPFPGYSLFNPRQEQDISLLHSLVEYEKSDWIDVACGGSAHETRKHYRIIFHSVGMALHVISGTCKVYRQ